MIYTRLHKSPVVSANMNAITTRNIAPSHHHTPFPYYPSKKLINLGDRNTDKILARKAAFSHLYRDLR